MGVKDSVDTGKSAWIEAHGSGRLKRAAKRGHSCNLLYTEERGRHLYGPTAHLVDEENVDLADSPTDKALDLADQLEAMETVKSAKVVSVWVMPEDGDEYAEPTVYEAICIEDPAFYIKVYVKVQEDSHGAKLGHRVD